MTAALPLQQRHPRSNTAGPAPFMSTAARQSRQGKSSQKPQAAQRGDPIRETVREVIQMEQQDDLQMGPGDHLADRMTAFSGSMTYVALHAVWFAAWIGLNLGAFGIEPFDPYPFGLLTMIVSLEAIFLATFVLISQNRQSQKADRRSKVDLQVNLISEREITKLVELVDEIHEELGLHDGGNRDPDVEGMRRTTYVSRVARAVDEAEKQDSPRSARGPRSAADTKA